MLSRRLIGWAFDPVPRRRIQTVRALVGAFVGVYLLIRTPGLLHLLSAVDLAPTGVVAAAPWLARPVSTAIMGGLALLLSVPFAFGLGHRWVGPLFTCALWGLLTVRSSYGMIFHTENLLLLHVLVLALAPSVGRGGKDEDTASVWPLRLMALVTGASYFVAGWAKLRLAGFDWISGQVLLSHIAYDTVRKDLVGSATSPLGAWIMAVPWILGPMAWATMVVELGAPLFVLFRWPARIWAAAAWAFHLGVAAMMFIGFPYPMSFIPFSIFFPTERLRWRKHTQRESNPQPLDSKSSALSN